MDFFSLSMEIQIVLLILVGIIASIIGVLFGAAGFVLMPTMLLLGIPIHTTIAANKFATGTSSLSNVLWMIIKRKAPLKELWLLTILASVGGVSGAILSTQFNEETMNILACIILIFMLIKVMKRNKNDTTSSEIENVPFSLTPFFIGMYDGGFGPGSGLMNINFFLKRNYHYIKAVAYTRFFMCASCLGAFMYYWFFGVVIWSIAIPVTIGSILGSVLALKCARFIKQQWIAVILPCIVVLLILQVGLDLLNE